MNPRTCRCLADRLASAVTGLLLAAGGVPDLSAAEAVGGDAIVRVVPAPQMPPVPQTRSPVDLFRELLGMTAAERDTSLAGRSAESRELILAKLKEYQMLPPDERELRLRVTELHYHLTRLMRAPATNRPALLLGLSEHTRELLETRLQAWDQLSPELRRSLLENEAAIRYFTDLVMTGPDQRVPDDLSPALREQRQAGLERWRALPETERTELLRRFNQFFELNGPERKKALETLSEVERRQLEKTLATFGGLTASQRQRCLQSFDKFARLEPGEQAQFLKNAERWQAMSPAERQQWRDLVAKMSRFPPLPTERLAPRPPVPGPPLPPRPPAISEAGD